MSTSAEFENRIRAYSPWGPISEAPLKESTTIKVGNVVVVNADGDAVIPAEADTASASVAFKVALEDALIGQDYTVDYDTAAQRVQLITPQKGDRIWIRTTADDIVVGDQLQVSPDTGQVQPFGTDSDEFAVIGRALTANVGNEQSDTSEANDLVLVEIA